MKVAIFPVPRSDIKILVGSGVVVLVPCTYFLFVTMEKMRGSAEADHGAPKNLKNSQFQNTTHCSDTYTGYLVLYSIKKVPTTRKAQWEFVLEGALILPIIIGDWLD